MLARLEAYTVAMMPQVPARGRHAVASLAVLVPVYNAPSALARTLRSIDAQSADFDVLVVDDGSTPPVVLDAAAYAHRLSVLRLPRNGGVAVALNAGLRQLLAGPYQFIARQDAGDLDVEGRLAIQLEFLREDPATMVVGGWAQVVDSCGVPLRIDRYPEDWAAIRRRMWFRSPFCHPAAMIRADVLRQLGGYDERYDLAEDYELFRRIARQARCANIPRVLVVREEGPTSVTVARRASAVWRRLLVQLRHFGPYEPRAYLGVLRSVLALAVPRRAVAVLRNMAPRAAPTLQSSVRGPQARRSADGWSS